MESKEKTTLLHAGRLIDEKSNTKTEESTADTKHQQENWRPWRACSKKQTNQKHRGQKKKKNCEILCIAKLKFNRSNPQNTRTATIVAFALTKDWSRHTQCSPHEIPKHSLSITATTSTTTSDCIKSANHQEWRQKGRGKRRGVLQQCSNEEKKTKTKTCRGREREIGEVYQ